jgi:hypothetical protein
MQGNYFKTGHFTQTSQQTIGGLMVQTITQQHLAASTGVEVIIVKPPAKIARKANKRTRALIFFM